MANNAPWFIQRATRNGKPLPGAKLYAYVVNTTIPKPIYSDVTLLDPLVTPLVSDGDGLYPEYFLGSGEYTFFETDALGNQNGAPRNFVSASGGGESPVPSSDSVASIESFPETEKDWFTDPDYEYFRDDGCFCWIIAAKNIDRIKWFKTISGWNSTYPSGKVSIWGAMLPSFSDGVKLAEFILPDADYVGVQALDLDASPYRWIGVACDPGLVDSGVAIMQTGMLLPPDVVALAPRFSGYIGQHVHGATFDTFPMIYGLDPKYMMTRWMALGVVYA